MKYDDYLINSFAVFRVKSLRLHMNYNKWDSIADSDDEGEGASSCRQREEAERKAELNAHARRADSLFNIAEATDDGERRVDSYASALDAYNEVLQAVADSYTAELVGDYGAEVAASANLNSACICIRLERWEQAVLMADAALQLHRGNTRSPQQQESALLSPVKLIRAHYFKAYALLMKAKHLPAPAPAVAAAATESAAARGGRSAQHVLKQASKEASAIGKLMQQVLFFDDETDTDPALRGQRDDNAVPLSQQREYNRLCHAIEEAAGPIKKSETKAKATDASGKAPAATASASAGAGRADDDVERIRRMSQGLGRGEELLREGRLAEAEQWYRRLLSGGDAGSVAFLRSCPRSQLAELLYGQSLVLLRLNRSAEVRHHVMLSYTFDVVSAHDCDCECD